MRSTASDEEIRVSEDGTTLPTVEVLTGRAFLTGKSGSGKSNTCSVVAEELLDRGFTLLVVDTDGEYSPLKEQYDVRHVGGDGFADELVGPEDAEQLAATSLTENVPVVLDVSGYDDAAVAEELVERVVAELFAREKEVRKPYLLIVEEMQEYMPQRGGGGDLATLLERVAKRGRKRGLGICGVSQRPSSVDKDFITQCDWMAWHRLTWQNDVDVVRRVLGPERADAIQTFEPGEAFLVTDWDDGLRRIRFRQKRTRDAGSTPGLDQYADRGTESREDGQGVEDAAEADDAVEDPESSGIPGGASEASTESGEETGGVGRPWTSAENPDGGGPALDGDRPRRPTPPSKPENRDGVGGNLLELGALVVYLLRVTWYRWRKLLFEIRTPRDEG